ncbi:MAG: LLM class F420-dependent oxidoreductase [Acidimicrobiia bacterium]|nr:LLM class F420-dependent oxidoreductase [Acidimicrobiia bacterium]
MDFGVVFPTTEIGDDPAAIRDYAQAAEDLGYRYVVAYDHVLGAVHADRDPKLWGPYTEQHPFHEPFVLFGFLAGVTTRLDLETAVIILPQRQTALVAKQAAEVDVLSGGRLRLGIGTGWNHVEYRALGVPWERRGARFDEQIEVMRRLWAEPVVDVDGTFHRIERAGIAPRPATGRIPIWFGGFSEVALRRAARTGDGFSFGGAGRQAADQTDRLRELLVEQGRDAAAFPIEWSTAWGLGIDKLTTSVERARAAGVSHFSVNTMSSTSAWAGVPEVRLGTVAEHIAALERFIGAVGG